MSRQLDLQIYLALIGVNMKLIPKERFPDYMREFHYSTNAEAMLILIEKIIDKGLTINIKSYFGKFIVEIKKDHCVADTDIDMPMAVAKAVYQYYSGNYWEGNN